MNGIFCVNEATDILLLFTSIIKQTSDALCVNTTGMLSTAVCVCVCVCAAAGGVLTLSTTTGNKNKTKQKNIPYIKDSFYHHMTKIKSKL